MSLIDPRLDKQKCINRAMQSYVLMMYEFVLELNPKNVLEIGAQRGQSTKTMLMALKMLGSGKLVSIDIKNCSNILGEGFEDLKPYWHFIKGSSHDAETFQKAKDALKAEEFYDMMFIDGDHKMPGVGQDFYEYSKLIKPGGIIMLHDVTNKNEDVKELWKEITWDKFVIDWGRCRSNVTPGFGIVRKP